MKKQIHIESIGNVTITDKKNYIGSGGEASVYKHGKYAIKIYHEPSNTISKGKIDELNKIQATNVLKPLHYVYDINQNSLIGYVMSYIKDTIAMCKLFTKSFKKQNNITPQMIAELVKKIQETVAQIHYDNCIVADLNEMNLLSSQDFKIPYFIDTDSYQTPSYRATAIMDSVRDRTVSFGTFNESTDWYAFAIIAFQLYINIHPYKGRHPNYKSNEWQKRMDEGISVFDINVTLPQVCNSFNVIPKRHLIWFEDIFKNNNRSEPPQIDVSVPVVIEPQLIVINSSDTVKVDLVVDIGSKNDVILNVYDFMGVKYFVTRDKIINKNIVTNFKGYDKVLLCKTNIMDPVICKLLYQMAIFENSKGDEIGKISTHDIMFKEGNIYTMYNGNFYRNSFRNMNNKIIHQVDMISQVSEFSSKMYEGFILQDLLGKKYFTIPLKNQCKNYYIGEIENHRIIEAKLERNVCVVIGERKGKYYRFVFVFDYKKDTYTTRIIDDIYYDGINFTTLEKGITILLIENNQIEVFADNSKIKIIENVPFDSSMKLMSFSNKVYFINENKLFSITLK